MNLSTLPPQLLISLRWIAVSGQFISIFIAYNGGDVPLPQLGIALALGFFLVERLSLEGHRLSQALHVRTLALSKEHRLTLATAVAHELGTPLTTISLVTQELLKDFENLPQHSDLLLIMDQVKNCRSLLEELAKTFAGEKPFPSQALPISATLAFIVNRLPPNSQKRVQIKLPSQEKEPILPLTPELIHGLNNILQNGWQFATSTLEIVATWDSHLITLIVQDDGPGYSPVILDRLGQPYISARPKEEEKYHLGLGLFIAQALLTNMGGTLHFKNDQGAQCQIRLNRLKVEGLKNV